MIDLERPQIPLVDADHMGAGPEGSIELWLVVHLHQGSHSQLSGDLHEPTELEVGERSNDEEHRVGVHVPGITHIQCTDGEVLA